ncbi:MAG: ATP/GTP-binding protein, partial [Deltaproteobacteria bacterium]|nr:ATP/GTP-binding protein [Deltaproteobacteria bacterium]
MPSIETKIVKKRKLNFEDYVDGVLKCDRAIIGQTITLVESSLPEHVKIAGKVLDKLSSKAGNSLRIGITGVPGVGKSTFIEALGLYLIEIGKKVAVLAVDPSSTIAGGSILGDKTRMERLAKEENCFIRPTPAAGTLGGVAKATMETI